jgi:hypothetical protein
MGYTTDFVGEFNIEPPLTREQTRYLLKFSNVRHMKRDEEKVKLMSDPTRESVGLPVGKEGEYFVGGLGHCGQDQDGSIIAFNDEPDSQPSLWCQWIPSDDGSKLMWDGNEKFYSYTEWLAYIETNFLKLWGRSLDGVVCWQGEHIEDCGILVAGQTGIFGLPGIKASDREGYYY